MFWEEHKSAPKGQRDADSSIVLETMDYSFVASISLYAFNVPRGSLYSFTRDNEGSNPSDLKEYGSIGVKGVGSMSRKTPKGFGLCTHPDVRGYKSQTHVCTRLSGKNPCISFFI